MLISIIIHDMTTPSWLWLFATNDYRHKHITPTGILEPKDHTVVTAITGIVLRVTHEYKYECTQTHFLYLTCPAIAKYPQRSAECVILVKHPHSLSDAAHQCHCSATRHAPSEPGDANRHAQSSYYFHCRIVSS
jgi:hypothetical protein